MLWTFIAVAAAAWIVQLLLGLFQMRRFTRRVKELRARCGRVAIGKAKGGLHAGCILLLAIDENYSITYGEILEGVTVFTRFRRYDCLNTLNLLDLSEEELASLPKQHRIAALSAKEDLTEYLKSQESIKA
ncbi:hypothetical protein TAMA11512_00410 [Selenomonas sp. TAMA-11512]|uniref:transcriptional regulator GutM n=1 Tax=Selenomonas sp. TAMA-11512 TaxID=3095337 RepID=UPI00308F1BC4|nr:hypothetical protein TAMA11512_00410 [Selenomonas sp. TAMA-11512]